MIIDYLILIDNLILLFNIDNWLFTISVQYQIYKSINQSTLDKLVNKENTQSRNMKSFRDACRTHQLSRRLHCVLSLLRDTSHKNDSSQNEWNTYQSTPRNNCTAFLLPDDASELCLRKNMCLLW